MVKNQNSHEKLQVLEVMPVLLLCLLQSLTDSFSTFPQISANGQPLPDVPKAVNSFPQESLFLFRPYFMYNEKQLVSDLWVQFT